MKTKAKDAATLEAAGDLQVIQQSNVIKHDSGHVNGEATVDQDDLQEIDHNDQNPNNEGGSEHVEVVTAARSPESIPATAERLNGGKEIDLDHQNSSNEGEAEDAEPAPASESQDKEPDPSAAGQVLNDQELSDDSTGDLVIDDAEAIEENLSEVDHQQCDPASDERPESVDPNDVESKGEVSEVHENAKDVIDDGELVEVERAGDDTSPSPDQNPCNLNLTCEEHMEEN